MKLNEPRCTGPARTAARHLRNWIQLIASASRTGPTGRFKFINGRLPDRIAVTQMRRFQPFAAMADNCQDRPEAVMVAARDARFAIAQTVPIARSLS
jgi:hypothetical protein